MSAKTILLTLKQKVFVVKSFYKNNEDLMQVLHDFNTTYDLIADAESSVSNFAAIVGSFEMTGSIVPLVLTVDLVTTEIPFNTEIKTEPLAVQQKVKLEERTKVTEEVTEEEIVYSNSCNEEEQEEVCDETASEVNPDPLEFEREVIVGETAKQTTESDEEWSPEKEYEHTTRDNPDGTENPLKLFDCSYCSKAFTSNAGLEIHLRTHTGERPYKCLYCDKAFNQKSARNTHLRLHTGESPYVCDYCGKAFKQSGNLNVHVKSRHLKPKVVKEKKMVTRIRVPRKPKPLQKSENNSHTCTYCPKSFPFNSGLEIHLRTHTGEKPYNCLYCDKTFNQRSSRNTHHRLHTGESPFICSYCGRAFKQSGNFKAHVQSRHLKQLQQDYDTPPADATIIK